MNSNYYGNRCNSCAKPTTKCSCSNNTAPTCKTTPKINVTIDVHDCSKVYGVGACVGTVAGYYKSLVDNNTVEPATGVQTNPQSWIGPLSLCDLIDSGVGQTGAAGPQGVAGPSGATGADGAAGAAGAAGAKGDVGEQGPTGPQGVDGVTGAQGVRGSEGPQGLQGADGATGAEGPRGTAGVAGIQGVVGATGTTGAQGVTGGAGPEGQRGLTGPQGIQGAQGEQGIRGDSFEPDEVGDDNLPVCPAEGTSSYLDGVNGLLYFCIDGVRQAPIAFGVGPQGATGGVGLTGAQGSIGNTGAQGPIGPQGGAGEKGERGEQGIAGNTGPQGVAGTTGQRGLQGITGEAGPQGVEGAAGPRGLQGVAGNTGTQGAQGATGAEGPQGATGVGVQGAQGASGSIGPTGPQGAFGGPQGETGAQGSAGPQGAVGEAGKDYDPDCQAPVVTDIACADARGNIAFTLDDGDVKYFHFKDYMPTAYTVAGKVDNGDGTFATVNPNGSVITWYSEPTNQVMVTDFEANGLYDHNHQMINFRVISKATGSCIGKGTWLIVIECDNCNCIVPVFTRNPNGSITLNDGKGLIETLWPAGHSSPVQPEKPFPVNTACELDESDSTSTLHGCIETSYLDVPKWNCETEFKVGAIEHDGHLYYNLVDGNTEHPSVGTSSGTYAGAFDLSGLIDYMLTKKLTDLGLI